MSKTSSSWITAASLVTALALGASATAHAAPQYTATAIGLYPSELYFPNAYAVNDSGTVTGYGFNGSNNVGFSWQNGQLTTYGLLPGAWSSGGYDINAAGVTVGNSGDQAIVWRNGQMQTLPSLGSATSATTYASASAINDSGLIAGVSGGHAVIWRDGKVIALPSLGNESSSTSSGINANGTVVGVSYTETYDPRPLMWQNGAVQQLTSGPYNYGGATDINNGETVVGYVAKGGNIEQAASWDHGTLTLLDELPDTNSARAFGINDAGLIVGDASYGGFSKATLWEGSHALSLQDQLTDGNNWQLWQALDINNAGQIIGWGSYKGQGVSFLLTPVPESSTALYMLVGLLAVTASARRASRP